MVNTTSDNNGSVREGLYVDAIQAFNMLEYLKRGEKNNGKIRAYNKVAKMLGNVAMQGVLITKKDNNVQDAEYKTVATDEQTDSSI